MPSQRQFRRQLKCQRYSCGKLFPFEGKGLNPEFCPACRESGYGKQATPQVRVEKQKKRLPIAKIGYTWETITIDKETKDNFEFPANRRKISEDQLANLRRALITGKHFESPIVVNIREGKMRVIDGNHRVTAVRSLIRDDPTYTIDVLCIKYQNLDEDGEIEVFNRWNVGRAPKTDDFIQQIAHRIKIIRMIQTDFPVKCTIYRQTDSAYMRLILTAYMLAKKNDSFETRTPGRRNFVDAIMELDEDDYAWIKDFCKQWKLQFNEPRYSNKYWTANVVAVGMYATLNTKGDLRKRIMRMADAFESEACQKGMSMVGVEAKRNLLADLLTEMKTKTEMRA